MGKEMTTETEIYSCEFCGTAIATRWTERGMISEPDSHVLVASWVFHASCWDVVVRATPPEGENE
jgi:hypothetical protein